MFSPGDSTASFNRRPCERRDPYAAASRHGDESRRRLSTTNACGYGSLRSQGRRGECYLPRRFCWIRFRDPARQHLVDAAAVEIDDLEKPTFRLDAIAD